MAFCESPKPNETVQNSDMKQSDIQVERRDVTPKNILEKMC